MVPRSFDIVAVVPPQCYLSTPRRPSFAYSMELIYRSEDAFNALSNILFDTSREWITSQFRTLLRDAASQIYNLSPHALCVGHRPSRVYSCHVQHITMDESIACWRKSVDFKGLLKSLSHILVSLGTASALPVLKSIGGSIKEIVGKIKERIMDEFCNCQSFCDCAWRIVLDRKGIYPLARSILSPFILYEHFQTWFKDSKESERIREWTPEEGSSVIALIEKVIAAITLSVSKNAVESLSGGSSEITFCQSWIRKMCRELGIFPSSLILKGVEQDKALIAIKCGGFADIFIGAYEGKEVALKVLRTDGTVERMKRMHEEIVHEALFWRYLDHKHIVTFIGIVQNTSIPRIALVTPWMKNGTISQYLEDNANANRLSLLAQIALGLKYLHDQKPPLIHGDIKAANILIDDDGFARLADFGLITISEVEGIRITQRSEHGSIRWMSPELMLENAMRTQKSDVYAFGMTVIEVYTGLPPFSTGEYQNDAQIVIAVYKGARPARPNNASMQCILPDEVWNLIEQCWSSVPTNRPTIQQIEEKLSSLCA